ELDTLDTTTVGVQTTLAGTLIASATLAGVQPVIILGGLAVLSYLMVAPITYPDLLPRDALIMGVIQALALLFPRQFDAAFPTVLLAFALAYLILSPRFYWR
ncbi:MAG: phosphatidylcholine/phosphatidylserine synthase, partial [Halobacteriaceae archaeon]